MTDALDLSGPLVPVVDLQRGDAAQRIDAACRQVGFLSVTGHGVPEATIAAMLEATGAFFALPLDEKLRWRAPRPEVNRGYAAKGSEALVYSLGQAQAPPDLFEAFNIGPDTGPRPDAVYEPERDRLFAANIWPDHPARRSALRPHWSSTSMPPSILAHRLTGLFARRWGSRPTSSSHKTDHSTDTLRVNNYTGARGTGPDRRPTAHGGPHRLRHRDGAVCRPGTRSADRGARRRLARVQPAEGAFLVNLGDLLAEWTNDRWRSTLAPGGAARPAIKVVRPLGARSPSSTTATTTRSSSACPTCCSAGQSAQVPDGSRRGAPDGQAGRAPDPQPVGRHVDRRGPAGLKHRLAAGNRLTPT